MKTNRIVTLTMLAAIVLGSLAGLGLVPPGQAPGTTLFLPLIAQGGGSTPLAQNQTYDISTLAGKVASLNGTQGLQTRFSAFIEEEATPDVVNTVPMAPITPSFVLNSPLDGASVAAPDVTVNLDHAAAPQNETAVAVDPNNPNRVVAAANDYVARTWSCTVSGTPCSALADGYSGTYYSNDGGQTWQGLSSGPGDLGTLIPGVTRLTGGPYDAGGDPALAFDSRGNVYYAGLGFNRLTPPNTVTVNKGTFDGSGHLSWSMPTFINQTTAPAILNDKEWIGADWHASSPFRDRVYVTWTRYIFNPINGRYVQSPIFFVYSSDGGQTFSQPLNISGNVLYSQGSRVEVGYDGTVYVFWEGSTRLAAFSSTYLVKSTDGGLSWSKPVAIAQLADLIPLANTAFRVNSFPAADVGPDGTLYVAWTTEMLNSASTYSVDPACAYYLTSEASVYANCHSVAVYSKSTDGGKTWSSPVPIFSALDASTQTPDGYPVTQPDGSVLNAPATPNRVDSIWPGVAVSASGRVYLSAYVADIVSPWQTCANPATPTSVGRINCLALGPYIDNARLNYYVINVGSGGIEKASTHPINTRHGFGGGFFGDYTDLAVGTDNVYHAFWTDSNNVQNVVWFYGFEFVPTPTNQQDVVMRNSSIP
jgi:hypothetical protein